MTSSECKNANHPKAGSSTLVEPIRSKVAIRHIKKRLIQNPRDYALFVIGINTGYRSCELLSIRFDQVWKVKPGDTLNIKQTKNNRYRRVTLNKTSVEAIQLLLRSRHYSEGDYLFPSCQYTDRPIQGAYLSKLVKGWCRDEKLQGNFASHTLRKTWGHWQYKNRARIPTIMKAFGHRSEAQTMAYLCIQPKDVDRLYKMEL